MYWPDTQTGVDVEPARKPVASAVRKYFTEGGAGTPPTVPGGDWFNQFTNEMLNVLAAAGIDPSKTDDDQLLKAINSISKAMSAREALRRTYAEAGFNLVPGSFELGGTVTTATDVLLYEADGHAYNWDGVFPVDGKVVLQNSTPASTGGVGPGLWLDQAGATYRVQQSGNDGASHIGTNNGISVQDSLDSLCGISSSQRLNLFKYKKIKTLAAIPPLVASIVASEEYIYLFPQAFSYGKNGDIFINMASDDGSATWVVRYDAAGAAVSAFNAFAGVSETSYFFTEGGVDYLIVGGKGVLKKFNVTSLPAGSSVQTPVSTQNPDVNFAGCGFGYGRMLLEEQAAPLSTVINRDRLFVWNISTGVREQSVTLPLQIAGAQGGTPYSDVLQKMQGFAAAPEGLYLAYGKNATPSDVEMNKATGICLANWQGNAESIAMVTAKAFNDFLVAGGVAPTRIENEGVTIGPDGFPHVLHAYLTASNPNATTEGIVICSVGDPVGSTDLSVGAIQPLTATYYGRSAGNILLNPYTGESMDTMAKVLDFMVATNTEEYHFYTTSATVLDLDGSAFPTGSMVRIYNPNNFTFFYEVINTKTRTLWYSLVPYSKNYAAWSGIGSVGDITNCITGDAAGKAVSGVGNSLYGHLSGAQLTTGVGNANFGQGAGRGATTAIGQSGLGRNAGWKQIDGTDNNFDLTTCIGQDSRVSGASQVQLGGAGTTPYAYNALQLRSDAYDKIGVRDTELGIDFIMGLRAVQGRWNLRESYFDEVVTGVDEDGNDITDLVEVENDGSRSGARFHNWFIAQEVETLCVELGVDFAGLQHHAVNGGADVYSLGYEEFIPPIVKSVQQCWQRLDELERRLDKLDLPAV